MENILTVLLAKLIWFLALIFVGLGIGLGFWGAYAIIFKEPIRALEGFKRTISWFTSKLKPKSKKKEGEETPTPTDTTEKKKKKKEKKGFQ